MLFFGKEKRHLLQWQELVMQNSPQKLVMSEKELESASWSQTQNYIRIANDCFELIRSTVNPETFFSRIDCLKETLDCLTNFEPYMKFKYMLPSEVMRRFLDEEQGFIHDFITRYFASVVDKAAKLKTESGKRRRYAASYDALLPYFERMDFYNKDYISVKREELLEDILNS